ncbi:MAG: hypothetical protein AAF741_08490 [Bacteroidota bacterium]
MHHQSNVHRAEIIDIPEDLGIGELRMWRDRFAKLQFDGDDYLEQMGKLVNEQTDHFLLMGNSAEQVYQDQDSGYLEEYLLFEWAGRARDYQRLWRDAMVESRKARVLHRIGQVDQGALKELHDKTLGRLGEVLDLWRKTISSDLQLTEKEQKNELYIWSKENIPWPTYRGQIKELTKQCGLLAEDYDKLEKISDRLEHLRTLLTTEAEGRLESLRYQQSEVAKLVQLIDEEEKAEKPSAKRIMRSIAEVESKLPSPTFEIDMQQSMLANVQELPAQTRIYIGTRNSRLLYKEVNFRTAVPSWIEGEVLPILYEIWEEGDLSKSQLQLALANIRNRLSVLDQIAQEPSEVDGEGVERLPADLEAPLVNYLDKTIEVEKSVEEYVNPLCALVNRELKLARIYDQDGKFLPKTTNAGFRQIEGAKSAVSGRFYNWFTQARHQLSTFIDRAVQEDKLSRSEKVVRAVQSRRLQLTYPAYANIFITRGYVGESFFTGRDAEIARMGQLVADWNKGYRGAVLLTGKRQSGKSLFGELITNRYFPTNVIRLSPGMPLMVNGRSFQTTYELRDALEFIKKHTISQRPAVWMDDLELWHDRDHPLGVNVAALEQFIDAEGMRMFFLVGCGNAAYYRLNATLNLARTFQARINLGRLALPDLVKAVFIRHGATHENLRDESGELLSEREFRKLVSSVYKTADGNVGDALRAWANSIYSHPDGGVVARLTPVYPMPGPIDKDSGLLLGTLMRLRRADEYDLRRVFGPSFPVRFRDAIRRLQGVGLLHRRENGELEITPCIVNEVGRLLHRQKYIHYEV